MHPSLQKYFEKYSHDVAPFMHLQRAKWSQTRPLQGVKVLHHVPVVPNTLLKIACLIEAGADVTVSNPSEFCKANPEAIACLKEAGIPYVEDLATLKGEAFDFYFDCGAQLYQALGKPRVGAIELTGSGDTLYRSLKLDFPVVSIDRTYTKQLETVFGCAKSISLAIQKLTDVNPISKSWIIFGFGKIGRGLAFFCVQNKVPCVVVDPSPKQRQCAEGLGIKAIDPTHQDELKTAITQADVVLTATGKKAIMSPYPKTWFAGKILANLGVYDEFGPNFTEKEILNNKQAVNFVLDDPTPMEYIDPEFYVHNIACLFFTELNFANGVHDLSLPFDRTMIVSWCDRHGFPIEVIKNWFVEHEDLVGLPNKAWDSEKLKRWDPENLGESIFKRNTLWAARTATRGADGVNEVDNKPGF